MIKKKAEREAIKKKKKEEEEQKQKNMSRGAKQKVNASGKMKSSSFFTKTPVKKENIDGQLILLERLYLKNSFSTYTCVSQTSYRNAQFLRQEGELSIESRDVRGSLWTHISSAKTCASRWL